MFLTPGVYPLLGTEKEGGSHGNLRTCLDIPTVKTQVWELPTVKTHKLDNFKSPSAQVLTLSAAKVHKFRQFH